MGNTACGCSGPNLHHNGMNMDKALEEEASFHCRSVSKKKTPKMKAARMRKKHIQHKQTLVTTEDTMNGSNYSNQSFDEEFYIETAKTASLLCPIGCYHFLIYIENNLMNNTLVYGYNRSLNIPPFINDMIQTYCCISNRNRLICIGVVMLDESMNMEEVKKSICTTFPNEIYTTHFNHIRLRHIWSRKQELLTNAYSNDMNLKQNCKRLCGGIRDNIRVCCQQINAPESCAKDHVVLRCAKVHRSMKDDRWYMDSFCDKIFDIITIHKVQYISMNIASDHLIQRHAHHTFNDEWIDYYVSNHPWRLPNPLPMQSGDVLLFAHESIANDLNSQMDVWK